MGLTLQQLNARVTHRKPKNGRGADSGIETAGRIFVGILVPTSDIVKIVNK
jgi:hypothetical protein